MDARDRCPASNVRSCLRFPSMRTSQPTGHRNAMIPVRSSDLTFPNEFAGCDSRNFKTTAPAEISVTGMHIPAGPVPPRGRTTAPGGPECVGMSAHAWAIRIA